MGRDKIKIAGLDELPREQPIDAQAKAGKHPFGQMNRFATRNETVNAATAIGRQVYDQIAEEHNKAIGEFYTEFEQYREVSARRIRELERRSISFQIRKSLRTDLGRLSKWFARKRSWLRPTDLERLAKEAARVHDGQPIELVQEAEILKMIQTGEAIALRWTGKPDDLKAPGFEDYYHEGMVVRTDGAIPLRDSDGSEELCEVGDLLVLKAGVLSVIKKAGDAQKEAAS